MFNYYRIIAIVFNIYYSKKLLFISYITHNSVFRHIRELFSIDHSTIFRKLDLCSTFLFKILFHFIKLLDTNEFQELARGFQNLGATPYNILAINSKYISINIPKINGENYLNKKDFYSKIFYSAVDYIKKNR